MRLSFLPCKLTREDAARLCEILARRHDRTRTLQDMERRHHVWPNAVEVAAADPLLQWLDRSE